MGNSTRSEVRSPTSTRSEVRSPTSTSTKAHTQGNFTSTVTGGAGEGATSVTIRVPGKKNPARYAGMRLTGSQAKMLSFARAHKGWHSIPAKGSAGHANAIKTAKELKKRGQIWLSVYSNGSAQFRARS